jgi:hypothetical protein
MPKIRQLREPEPSIINEKTIADFTRVVVQTGILVATSEGPTMFARIGVMQALNRGHVREFNPKQNEPHWGRRKLARDR